MSALAYFLAAELRIALATVPSRVAIWPRERRSRWSGSSGPAWLAIAVGLCLT
jgi:hypothetical protein